MTSLRLEGNSDANHHTAGNHPNSTRRSLALATLAAVTVAAAACTPQTGGGDPSPDPENEVTVTVDGKPVTVAGPTGSTLEVTVADPSTLPPSPKGTSFPLGAFTIDLSGITTGAVARVTITLPTSADSVRKLIGGAWDPFAHDGVTGAQLSGDGLTLTVDLQDGGRGDADGVANGTIQDRSRRSSTTRCHPTSPRCRSPGNTPAPSSPTEP